MLHTLELSNFRRIASATVPLHAGVSMIAGPNGAGKTTLLEAITYALYGEGRHGSRWLDTLVRRGAEHEGLEVALTFDLDGDDYTVRRKRISGSKASALLTSGDGTDLAESTSGVTRVVTNLLGMDAAGFRLAVLAQQGELDALASLRPGERREMISRLLRLDALTVAGDRARGYWRSTKQRLDGLGDVPDVKALQAVADASAEQAARLAADVERLTTAITDLDAEIELTESDAAKYALACRRHDEAVGAARAARAAADKARSAFEAMPEPQDCDRPTTSIEDATRQVETRRAEIREVERQHKAAKAMQGVVAEHERVAAALAQAEVDLAALPAAVTDDLEGCVATAAEELDQCRAREREVADDLAAARARHADLSNRIDAASELGAECDRCSQPISDSHRHDVVAGMQTELAALVSVGETLKQNQASAAEGIRAAERQLQQSRQAVAEEAGRAAEHRRLSSAVDDLRRRLQVHADQLATQPSTPPPLGSLRSAMADAERTLADTRSGHARADAVARARREHTELAERAAEADAAAVLATQTVTNTTPPVELVEAHTRHQRAQTDRAKLVDELGAARTAHGREDVRSQAAARDVAAATKVADRASTLRRTGEIEAASGELLKSVHDDLRGRVRPMLEGTASQLLTDASDGRFTSLTIDSKYDIHVLDDGETRPLTEVSGGEADLIALSLRLALSQVVQSRHGGPGLGTIVLDEPLGALDPIRQAGLLSALRRLQQQVVLVSHVAGLDDQVNSVIRVNRDDDTVSQVVAN